MNMDAWLGVAGIGIAFIVNWGVSKAKVAELERRTTNLETDVAAQLELVHGLRDVYVSREHFNEIMETIRDSQRELKEDLKRVIELLSARGE